MRAPVSRIVGLLALGAIALPTTAVGQGVILQGVGPVNRAMGGASVAAPIDAAGALRWNPASISGLACSEVTFGAELLLQTEDVSSTVPTINGPLSGSTGAEPGASVIPEVAWVHRDDCSRWTYGLGLYGVAGFKANYPASVTNPVLMPQPNGLGRVYAELEVFDVVPTISYALTPRLAVGFAPVLSMGTLNADPLFLVSPDDANGDMFPMYPHGLGSRYHYGGGVQLGMYYIGDNGWHYGASLKSPTWFEDFRFHTEDEIGAPRLAKLDIDLPMIVSVGFSYSGIERWLWAVDARYFDYKNTNGFGATGYDQTGAGTGLGWDSIFSIASGLQYQATDRLVMRMGYTYQENPIPDANAFFNVASPLIIGHIGSVGASWYWRPNIAFNVAYLRGFEGDKSGPIVLPGIGAVPGSNVTSEVSADALGAGVTVRY
ncbi:MAG: outer membrane protein transport protein [Pirellulales bacterium]